TGDSATEALSRQSCSNVLCVPSNCYFWFLECQCEVSAFDSPCGRPRRCAPNNLHAVVMTVGFLGGMVVPDGDEIRRWSTSDVPQAGRLDYFATALSDAVSPLMLDSADPLTFHADASFAQLDVIGVFKATASCYVSSRGPSEIARAREHTFSLIVGLD